MLRNPYKLLRDLLPQAPLQVGRVVSVLDGLATLETPGGGTATARGVATVNTQVYYRDDVIEGPAPDLPVEVIVV